MPKTAKTAPASHSQQPSESIKSARNGTSRHHGAEPPLFETTSNYLVPSMIWALRHWRSHDTAGGNVGSDVG